MVRLANLLVADKGVGTSEKLSDDSKQIQNIQTFGEQQQFSNTMKDGIREAETSFKEMSEAIMDMISSKD